jgi:hypothetical protein
MILASARFEVAAPGHAPGRARSCPMIGSRPLMSRSMEDATYARAAWLALIAAVVAIAAATWSILSHEEPALAGAAVAGAGVALLVGGALARRSPGAGWLRRWWFIESAIDRAFDGALLGSIAWTAREADPAVCAAALVALGAGFLGSYVHARGAALGYEVEDGWLTRLLRYGLLAAGLLLDELSWAVWAVAAVSIAAIVVRTSQVAKQERT